MDRQFLAGVASIVAIVCIVAWQFSGATPFTPAASSGLTGNVVLQPTELSAPVEQHPEPLVVTARVNGGTLSEQATLQYTDGSYNAVSISGTSVRLDALSVRLDGSATATAAEFTLARDASHTYPLAVTRSEDGTWITIVDAAQLHTIQTREGPGQYTFTGVAIRGTEQATSRTSVSLS